MHGVVVCEVCLNGIRYLARLDRPQHLHIPLEFDALDGPPPAGPAPPPGAGDDGGARQPNHFGAPRACAWPLRGGAFTGDTRRGGSCNASVVQLTPHCNGTHTESVGHLSRERLSLDTLLADALQPAGLVSVTPAPAPQTAESAAHPLAPEDRLVTAAALASRLDRLPPTTALIVRTWPNDPDKRWRRYEGSSPAPFFSLEAARLLVERGIRHVLVDVPSLDRAHDGGHLGAHRAFWGLPPAGAVEVGAAGDATAARSDCTITEMIYADDTVADGLYLLNLQVAPFALEASPARVVVFPLEAA